MDSNSLAFLLVGILLGALPGYLIGQSMATNPYPVPKTKEECFVAVGMATTQAGANLMDDYCVKKYGDF